MVAVIIIAVVFTGMAGTLFWAAPRGKLAPLSKILYSQTKRANTTVNLSLAVVMVGMGIVVPAIFLVNNANSASTSNTGGVKLTAGEVNGRALFGMHCAVCHTLASADAIGKIGPNLDQLKPSYTTIMHTLQYGCLTQPASSSEVAEACLGYGTMAADIVDGQDAVDVARYVAAVAGKAGTAY